MTDEQIRQNAEICVFTENTFCKEHKKLILTPSEEKIAKDFYIAGAHSRDEEVAYLTYRLNDTAEKLQTVIAERDNLLNPWISIKERLPENNCVVFVSLEGTEYLSAHYRAKSKRFVTVSKDKQTLVEVRKSAATYTVCGDCIKEERLYSEGEREDVTAIVTHWMPFCKSRKKIRL